MGIHEMLPIMSLRNIIAYVINEIYNKVSYKKFPEFSCGVDENLQRFPGQ
jgi:hypothetical protein